MDDVTMINVLCGDTGGGPAINYEEGLGKAGQLQAGLEGRLCLFAPMSLIEVGYKLEGL